MNVRCFVARPLVAALLLAMTPAGFAATNIVKVGNYYFSPTNITINAGDTIMWSNVSLNTHDTTQQTNLWASSEFPSKGTYSFTFTNAGYYPYYCAKHIVMHPESTGTVTVVTAPNNPPNAVTLLNPLIGGGQFLCSFQTQTGYTYSVLGKSNLVATNWQTLQTFPGSGGVVAVSNDTPNAQRFYRVVAQ